MRRLVCWDLAFVASPTSGGQACTIAPRPHRSNLRGQPARPGWLRLVDTCRIPLELGCRRQFDATRTDRVYVPVVGATPAAKRAQSSQKRSRSRYLAPSSYGGSPGLRTPPSRAVSSGLRAAAARLRAWLTARRSQADAGSGPSAHRGDGQRGRLRRRRLLKSAVPVHGEPHTGPVPQTRLCARQLTVTRAASGPRHGRPTSWGRAGVWGIPDVAAAGPTGLRREGSLRKINPSPFLLEPAATWCSGILTGICFHSSL